MLVAYPTPKEAAVLDPSYRLAVVATKVRRSAEALGEISAALSEMERLKLSTEALDLAVKVADLHYQLVDLMLHPVPPPSPQSRPHKGQQQLPF